MYGAQYMPTERAPVHGFYVHYKPYEDRRGTEPRRQTVAQSDTRRIVLHSLTPETTYSFKVQAFNQAGPSGFSNTAVKATLGG